MTDRDQAEVDVALEVIGRVAQQVHRFGIYQNKWEKKGVDKSVLYFDLIMSVVAEQFRLGMSDRSMSICDSISVGSTAYSVDRKGYTRQTAGRNQISDRRCSDPPHAYIMSASRGYCL